MLAVFVGFLVCSLSVEISIQGIERIVRWESFDTVNIVSQETKQLLIQLAGAKELTTTPQ